MCNPSRQIVQTVPLSVFPNRLGARHFPTWSHLRSYKHRYHRNSFDLVDLVRGSRLADLQFLRRMSQPSSYAGLWEEWRSSTSVGGNLSASDGGDPLTNRRPLLLELAGRLSEPHNDVNPTAYPSEANEPLGFMMLEYASRLNQECFTCGSDPFDPRPIDPTVELSLQAEVPRKRNQLQEARSATLSSHNEIRGKVVPLDDQALSDGCRFGMALPPTLPRHSPTDHQQGYQQLSYVNYSYLKLNHPCSKAQDHLTREFCLKTATTYDYNPPPTRARTKKTGSTFPLRQPCNSTLELSTSHRYSLDLSSIPGSAETSHAADPAPASLGVGYVPTFDDLPCAMLPALSLHRLRGLMKKSISSQELLQEWDMKRGLPKCHSWTMMHTSRSRRQIMEGRVLPKWNGKPLIGDDEEGCNRSTPKKCPKRKKP
jgi:hypothetical protein